jgi:hypothetical protein
VRHDTARDAAEHRVSRGVIAVMVGVEQHINRTVVRPRLQPGEQSLRLGRKLRVDHGDAPSVHQPADSASAHRERPHVAAHWCEHGLPLQTRPVEREDRPPEGDA